MARLVIRILDEDVRAMLQQRAQRHGRTAEEEVLEILREAVRDEALHPEPPHEEPLGTRIRAPFKDIGFKKGEIREWRGYPAKTANFQ